MTPRAWKRLFARITLWTGVVIALVLLFFLGTGTWSVYNKNHDASQARLDEADQLSELTARQKALSSQIDALATPRGVDAAVREMYPVAKSGEEVIVLTDSSGTATDTSARPPQNIWEWLASWFSW